MKASPAATDDRSVRWILLALLVAVPLLPNPGFTNYDSPKWALLVVGLLVAGYIVLTRAVRRKGTVKVGLPEQFAVLALAAVAGLLLAKRAPDRLATVRTLGLIGSLTTAAILASRYLKDGRWARRALTAMVVAGGAGALIGIIGSISGASSGISSTFGNPSFAAEFFAPVAVLAAALFLLGRRKVAVVGGLLSVTGVVLSGSRADWLGLAAGLAVLAALEILPRLKRKVPARLLTALILGGIVALPYLIQILPVPLFGRSDTVVVREHLRSSAYEMGMDHSMSGVGLEGFGAVYPDYRSPEEFRISLRREVTFAHNLPLSVFAEVGIPGLLLLAWFLWVTLSSGIRTVLAHRADGIAFSGTGAIVAILVSAQFSAPLRHPASALLFFVLAGMLVGRRPGRFVTDLKGRYRKAVPVLILLVPVGVAAVRLLPHLVADARLKAARDGLIETSGGIDADTAKLLEKSIEAEPTVDALRMLAFYQTETGAPEAALATLDRLFTLAPRHGHGRVERARALIATKRPADALKLLDELAKSRPGDDIVLLLRCSALRDLDRMEEASNQLFALIKTSPLDLVPSQSRFAHEELPTLVPALIRLAERLGPDDPDRALAILSSFENGEAAFCYALVLTANGKLDDAMSWLRVAIRMGAADRDRLMYHPGLEKLRGRADFGALLR